MKSKNIKRGRIRKTGQLKKLAEEDKLLEEVEIDRLSKVCALLSTSKVKSSIKIL
jgi:hypothetical protein